MKLPSFRRHNWQLRSMPVTRYIPCDSGLRHPFEYCIPRFRSGTIIYMDFWICSKCGWSIEAYISSFSSTEPWAFGCRGSTEVVPSITPSGSGSEVVPSPNERL